MDKIIVAAEIGNSKLAVMAAEKMSDGKLKVLAVETEPTPKDCVSNGLIVNRNELVARLNGLIKKLSNRLEGTQIISKIYVGLNARTVRALSVQVSQVLDTEEKITEETLANLENEAISKLPQGKMLLGVKSVTYELNGSAVENPCDMVGGHLLATYVLMTANSQVVDSVKETIKKMNGCELADCVVSPVATADLLASDDDKKSGCAVVDFGAGCTSVAVYKDGNLKNFAVVPLGGNQITSDLMTLNLSEKEVEKLKPLFGEKYLGETKKTEKLKFPASENGEERIIEIVEFQRVFQARLDEILRYVTQQIDAVCKRDELSAGLILTGGLANIQHAEKIVSDLTSMPARVGSHVRWFANVADAVAGRTEYAQLVGTIISGTEHCLTEEQKKQKTQSSSKGKSVKEKVGGFFDRLFDDND